MTHPFARAIETVRQWPPEELQRNFIFSKYPWQNQPSGHLGFYFQYFLGYLEVGYGFVRVKKTRDEIQFHKFYPHDKIPFDVEKGELGLTKIGLGTLAHVTTLVDIVTSEQIPKTAKITHSPSLSDARKEHLKNMGVYGVGSLEEYMGRCIGYARGKRFVFDNPFAS